MKPFHQKLVDYLEVEGWECVQIYQDHLEWWADEIWEVKSRWAPADIIIFLTLLVDPMWEGNRKKGQGVWAVGCSRGRPRNAKEAQNHGLIRVRGSKHEMEEFLEQMNRLRDSVL